MSAFDLSVVNPSDVLYTGAGDITTVELGSGKVVISSLMFPGCEPPVVGVAFSYGGSGKVGDEMPEHDLKTTVEVNSFLQIVATNPESLDVLIGQLVEARSFFNPSVVAEKLHPAVEAELDLTLPHPGW